MVQNWPPTEECLLLWTVCLVGGLAGRSLRSLNAKPAWLEKFRALLKMPAIPQDSCFHVLLPYYVAPTTLDVKVSLLFEFHVKKKKNRNPIVRIIFEDSRVFFRFRG